MAIGAVAHAPAAGAATLGLTCAGPAVSGSVGAPVTAAAPTAVPEDGAALLEVRPSLPAGRAGAGVTKVSVTFTIPQQVADVDLTFTGGNVPARHWDARGGERIVVFLETPAAVPYESAQLPAITIVHTFDPGTAGRTVSWPVYRALSVETVGDGAGTTECSTADPGATWATTAINAPTAKHDTVIPAKDATMRFGPSGAVTGLPAAGPGSPGGGPAPAGDPAAPVTAPSVDPATGEAPVTTATAGGPTSTSSPATTAAPDGAVEDAARPGLTAADKPVWVLVLAGLLAVGTIGLIAWFARGERGLS